MKMTKYYDDIKIGSEVNMRIYDKIKKVKVCDIVIEAYMGHYMTVVKYNDGVSIRKSFLNDFIENIIFDDDFLEGFEEKEEYNHLLNRRHNFRYIPRQNV